MELSKIVIAIATIIINRFSTRNNFKTILIIAMSTFVN